MPLPHPNPNPNFNLNPNPNPNTRPCARSFGGDLEPDDKRDRLGRDRDGASTAAAASDDEDAPVNGSSAQQGGAATAVIDVDAEPAGEVWVRVRVRAQFTGVVSATADTGLGAGCHVLFAGASGKR